MTIKIRNNNPVVPAMADATLSNASVSHPWHPLPAARCQEKPRRRLSILPTRHARLRITIQAAGCSPTWGMVGV